MEPGRLQSLIPSLFTQSEKPENPVLAYWPTWMGLLVCGLVVYAIWPEDPPPPPPLPSGVVVAEPEQPAVTGESSSAPRRQQSTADFEQPSQAPQPPTMAFQEIERPVWREVTEETAGPSRTYTQDDPEVKKALRGVSIEVYAAADDEEAQKAAQFLKGNSLGFRRHDWDEPMAQERARRLSGSSDGLTLVVDGQVLKGFSQGQLQSALALAAKKRIEHSEQP